MGRALVLGYGESGKAAVLFLQRRGWLVSVADRAAAEGQFSDGDLAALNGVELVVVSPGIAPTQLLYAEALARGIPVIGEVELGLRHLRQRAIGITGTNGKTTVTLMTAHVLNQSGLKAVAVGNVGTPLTQALESESADAIFVIELSSWQLETVSTKALDAAVVLNITPDHLDRHVTMEHYAAAKAQIQEALKPEAPLYLHTEVAQEFGYFFDAWSEYGIGSHDVDNRTAACLLCQTFGVQPSDFERAMKDFRKPPHRIEFVRHCRGVDFIDDSKGTNVDAVIKAVQSIAGSVVLIAGGVDKEGSYRPWVESFPGRVRAVFAIGQAAARIGSSLEGIVPVTLCANLEDAVKYAAEIAQSGETVLLSPGCASYDMFKNYKHRGLFFQELVHQLCEQKEGHL